MTFITLTDADNGQAVEVRGDQVQGIRVFDQRRTLVLLIGGHEVEVRESVDMVKAAVNGWATPRARLHEEGRW